MNYEGLRLARSNLVGEQSKLISERETIAKGKSLIEADLAAKESNVENSVKDERTKAMEIHLKAVQEPYLRDIQDIELESGELDKLYQEETDGHSVDSILEGLLEGGPLSDRTKESIARVKELAYGAISPRFIEDYWEYLPSMLVSEEDFLTALDSVSDEEGMLENYNSGSIIEIVTNVANTFKRFSGVVQSEGEGKNTGMLVIGVGIFGLVACIIVFPLYLVVLAGIGVFNLLNTGKLKHSLIVLKIVEDNYGIMRTAMQSRAQVEYDRMMKELTDEYEIIKKEFDDSIASVKKDMSEKLISEREIFNKTFDDNSIRERLQTIIIGVRNQLLGENAKLSSIDARLSEIGRELKAIDRSLENCVSELEKEYLSYEVGSSMLFPKRFLIELKPKPLFLDFAGESLLFIYSSRREMINFVKLMTVEMRCQMVPSALHVEVWDSLSAGAELQMFGPVDVKRASSMFNILSAQESFNNSLRDLIDIFKKRISVVRRDFENIQKYNEFMISQESVPENYKVVFIQNIEAIMEKSEFIQILREGPSVGIFIFLFMSKDKYGENVANVIRNVNRVIELTNDIIQSRSKDYVLESICKR
jgi:hypothetical protein